VGIENRFVVTGGVWHGFQSALFGLCPHARSLAPLSGRPRRRLIGSPRRDTYPSRITLPSMPGVAGRESWRLFSLCRSEDRPKNNAVNEHELYSAKHNSCSLTLAKMASTGVSSTVSGGGRGASTVIGGCSGLLARRSGFQCNRAPLLRPFVSGRA
jgi:hypothetical protein